MPFLLLINDQIEERGKTRKNHHPLAVVYVRHPHLLGHGLVVVSRLLGTRLQSRMSSQQVCKESFICIYNHSHYTCSPPPPLQSVEKLCFKKLMSVCMHAQSLKLCPTL